MISLRLHIERMPIRGKMWVIALAPYGAVVFCWSPKLLVRFLGMNDYFDPPSWMQFRL